MSNRMLPLSETDFWWLRYGLGIAVPLPFIGCGIYSIVTQHSYTYLRNVGFVPVEGKQAILMGIACIGIALSLFANCYAQYHEKMAYYYQWILGPGAILAGGGFLWCSWIFLIR
jgi:hypothetical protein